MKTVLYWILLIILLKVGVTMLILTVTLTSNNVGFLIASLIILYIAYRIILKLFPSLK